MFFFPRALKYLNNIGKLKSRYIRPYNIILSAVFMPKQNFIIILVQVNLIKDYLRLSLDPEVYQMQQFSWLKMR